MRWWTQEAKATGEGGAHIRVQQRLGELVRAHYLAFARLQMPAPHANDCGADPRHRQGSRSLCVCSRRQILPLLSEFHMSWAMFCDGLEADLRQNSSIAIDEGSSGACRGRSRAHGQPVSGGRRRGRAWQGPCARRPMFFCHVGRESGGAGRSGAVRARSDAVCLARARRPAVGKAAP